MSAHVHRPTIHVLKPALVWDLRAFKKPLASHGGLATLYPTTNAIFSPDDKFVVTGSGASSKGAKGRLMFLRKDNLESVKELEVETTPVKVCWHSKINQVRLTAPTQPLLTQLFADCDRLGEWSDMCTLLAADIHQRCKAAI